LEAFQKLDLPWNAATVSRSTVAKGRQRSKKYEMNAWAFRCHGLELLVLQHPDRVSIEAYSRERKLHGQIATRLCEAMDFVVGQSVSCEIVKTRRSFTTETIVRRRAPAARSARWQPPLAQQWVTVPGTNRITSKYHRRLFERFLAHSLASDKLVHSISGQLAAVREASAGRYIDAYALTLCVAIESLLNTEDWRVRLPQVSQRNVHSLSDHVKRWHGPQGVKVWVVGALAQLRQRRATDVLRALVTKGAITRHQYAAWQTLRNTTAHEYQAQSMASDRLRELLSVVQVMFYHLVFRAIRYTGPYTDYSLIDWPVKEYPARTEGA
jgi:hypothetical protein